VNTLLLFLLAGFMADSSRNYRFRAGLWLAGAICLKVIPAFLLIVPLVRRDLRGLGACALGLVLGVIVLPTVALGPERAYETTRTFIAQTLEPGIGKQGNGVVAKELTNITATDNQSIQAIVHNLRHWAEKPRPALADGLTKAIHVGAVLLMTALTFLFARRIQNPKLASLFLIGNLMQVMILASPVCHHHYFCMCLPAMLLLIGLEMHQHQGSRFGYGMLVLILAELATGILPKMPGLEKLRDAGVSMQGALILWGASLFVMSKLGADAIEKPMIELEEYRRAA
jgi:hypothetical protein